MDEAPNRAPVNPAIVVLSTALMVGSIAFFLGFVGPVIFLKEANQGPLLGIFVTGPLGLLVGALAGIIISARQNSRHPIQGELWWLAGVWVYGQLYALSIGSLLMGGWGLVFVMGQVPAVVCAAFLLYSKSVRLPNWARQGRSFILFGAVLIILTSIFPPIKVCCGEYRFAFFLDQRFDSSKNVPDYVFDRGMLIIEWLIIIVSIAVAVLASALLDRSERS